VNLPARVRSSMLPTVQVLAHQASGSRPATQAVAGTRCDSRDRLLSPVRAVSTVLVMLAVLYGGTALSPLRVQAPSGDRHAAPIDSTPWFAALAQAGPASVESVDESGEQDPDADGGLPERDSLSLLPAQFLCTLCTCAEISGSTRWFHAPRSRGPPA
jgi:hypothetical protein